MIYLLFVVVTMNGDIREYPLTRYEEFEYKKCIEVESEFKERFSQMALKHFTVEATCRGIK